MTTDMTDEELSRAVALRLATVKHHAAGVPVKPQWPVYAESMDACRAPGGPVEYLRARGMMRVTFGWPDGQYTCQIWRTLDDWAEGNARAGNFWGISAETEERALCLAFLAATEGDHA